MNEVLGSLNRFGPETLLTLALLLVVVIDSTLARWRDRVNLVVTAAALLGALVLCQRLYVQGYSGPLFSGMLVLDPMSVFFKMLLIGASLLVLLAFRSARELEGLGQSEFDA